MKAEFLCIATYTDKTRRAWLCFITPNGLNVYSLYVTLKEANKLIKGLDLEEDTEETENNTATETYKYYSLKTVNT